MTPVKLSISKTIKFQIAAYVREVCELLGSFRYSRPALDDLDKKLEKYLGYRNGFFIEAGANDGYAQSNTYYLEKRHGWTGVLVEPIPELFEKCKLIRKKSTIYNCALVENSATNSVVMRYANLMSLVNGVFQDSGDEEKHINDGLSVQNIGKSYEIQVSSVTLESILDGYCSKKIDFMSLDVEGYELDVLKGMNLDKYRPEYILIETHQVEAVNNLLQPYYQFVEALSQHDYLYKAIPGMDIAKNCNNNSAGREDSP